MEKLLKILAKLGIFRYGAAKGIYKNAKEKPDELMFDDVYNSKQDLTNKEDVKKVAQTIAKEDVSNQSSTSLPTKRGLILFWLAVVLGIFFLLGSFTKGWLTVLIVLIAWVVFIFLLRKFIFLGQLSLVVIVVSFLIVLIFSLMLVGSNGSKNNSQNKHLSKNSQELAKYDGKVLNISSADGKIKGKVGLSYYKKGRKLQAVFHIFVIDNLPENKVCFTCKSDPKNNEECRSWDKYNYAATMVESSGDKKKSIFSNGLMPIFCKNIPDISNPSKLDVGGTYFGCFEKQIGKDITTNKFYFSNQKLFNSIEEIKSPKQLKVYDAKDYTTRDSCVDGQVAHSFEGQDTEKAVKEGKLIKTYQLIFSE